MPPRHTHSAGSGAQNREKTCRLRGARWRRGHPAPRRPPCPPWTRGKAETPRQPRSHGEAGPKASTGLTRNPPPVVSVGASQPPTRPGRGAWWALPGQAGEAGCQSSRGKRLSPLTTPHPDTSHSGSSPTRGLSSGYPRKPTGFSGSSSHARAPKRKEIYIH